MLTKNKPFRTLLFAYGLATLGDWFDFIAVAIFLGYVWHADPMTMALLPIAYAAPGILLGQFAGVLADRVHKVRMMIAANLMQASLTLLLLAMPDPLWFLVVIAVRSCASVFNDPAQQTLTRQIVAPEQLLQATSLNGAVFQSGKLIGPLIGGMVAAMATPALCLLLNAGSYLLSTVLLSTMRHVEKKLPLPASREKAIPFRLAWQEGWAVFLQNRVLLASSLFSLLAMMAIQLADAQLPVVFREKVPGRPEVVGYSVSIIGLGALLTITWLHRRQTIRSYGWVLGGGVLLIGACFAWIGLFQPGDGIHWLLAASLFAGIGTGLTSVGTNYLVQKETPPHALGRVRGILDSLSSATFIVAPLLGGALMTWLGPTQAFLWVGSLVAAVGGGAILLQRWIWGKHAADTAATAAAKQAG
ncbi:MFS transporter [Brevibacillus sp. SAFN-007a]|uniref:MFS transporter n=1 Tax=Brevibacillus sp. SAFN-007a TaxID=3436862 RepID=UPI003F7FFB03